MQNEIIQYMDKAACEKKALEGKIKSLEGKIAILELELENSRKNSAHVWQDKEMLKRLINELICKYERGVA